MFPRPDPWEEQAKRERQDREDRRRRRHRWLLPIVGLALVSTGAVAWFLIDRAVGDGSVAEPAIVAVSVESTTTVVVTSPPSTVSPNELVEVDRVWLIDRGDGVFDWGVSVRTPPTAPTRSGVVIDVRLLGADDDVVEEASGQVDGVGPESVGAVTGRLSDAPDVPVRIEFDVAVGVVADDRALGDMLDLRGLEREDDSVSGRVRTATVEPIQDVMMVLLWLDDAGDVVAAVPQPVERVRPDVDARFDIDLGDEVVPDGRPDTVVWTR